MKSRALACLAALSLLAAPAAVQAAKPGEVELQIEATAQVPPDRAVVPITITGSGETEATAREDLRKKENNLMAALSAKGIDAAKVKVEGADGSKDGLTVRASDADAACAGAAAAAAAADAQEAAAAAPKKHKAAAREVDFSNCDALTYQTASKTLLVSFDDPSKIEQVQKLGDAEENFFSRLRPIFTQSDPAAARKKARSEALAKANAEADAYAQAMGYRVVRIVRVSNARPQLSMFDLMGFFGNMENKTLFFQPSWFGSAVVETVSITYVIAPK